MGILFLLVALGPQWHWGSFGWGNIPTAPPRPGDASWTPYGILNRVIPFMRISRSVGRFALMVQLCLAVAASLGLAGLLVRLARRTSPMSAHAGGPLASQPAARPALVSSSGPRPIRSARPTRRLLRQLGGRRRRAVLNLPMNYDRPGYLLYQTVHGKPLTVAYISRDDPRTLTERMPVLQHFRHLGPDILDVDPAAVGPTVLADLGVGTVVLDRYKMPGGDERTYTERLGGQSFPGRRRTTKMSGSLSTT